VTITSSSSIADVASAVLSGEVLPQDSARDGGPYSVHSTLKILEIKRFSKKLVVARLSAGVDFR
jgi:hypothetical protein